LDSVFVGNPVDGGVIENGVRVRFAVNIANILWFRSNLSLAATLGNAAIIYN
jgi:hypothetical protein